MCYAMGIDKDKCRYCAAAGRGNENEIAPVMFQCVTRGSGSTEFKRILPHPLEVARLANGVEGIRVQESDYVAWHKNRQADKRINNKARYDASVVRILDPTDIIERSIRKGCLSRNPEVAIGNIVLVLKIPGYEAKTAFEAALARINEDEETRETPPEEDETGPEDESQNSPNKRQRIGGLDNVGNAVQEAAE